MKTGLHKQDQAQLKRLLKKNVSRNDIVKHFGITQECADAWIPRKKAAPPTPKAQVVKSDK